MLVDVAVPRDLDAAIGELEGCTLFDIDDLGDGLVGREEDVREAEEIVAKRRPALPSGAAPALRPARSARFATEPRRSAPRSSRGPSRA